MAVPLIDITRQYTPIRAQIDAAIKKVMDHGQFILGPEVKQCESAIASFCGTKYAIGVASGTDALLIALRACGVVPGDEVITADFSFFASAGVISRVGARPVFVDIDKSTYNIDPSKIEAAITTRTKAIMPIHLFGQCADMDSILEIARRHNLKVIEDAAQAIGSKYKERQAGAIGDAGCFSFFPTKNLGCAGDGGMIVTNDDEIARQASILRVHGGASEYHHEMIGYNSRFDTIQAALILAKLPYLSAWTEARRVHAEAYNTAFKGLPIVTPAVGSGNYHIYNQYTIALEKREELTERLKEKRIGHKVYYPLPFHLQKCFSGLGYKKDDFPNSEWAAQAVLSIPVFGEMTGAEQGEVIRAIKEFYTQ